MLTGLLCKPVCRRAAFSLLFIDNSFQIPAKLTRWPGETTCLPCKVQPDALLMFTQPKIHFTDLHDVTVERAHFFYRAKFYISTLSRFNSGDYEARRFNTAHYGIVLLIDVVVELFIVSSFSRCEPCLLKPLIISYVIFIYCKASTNPTCIFYDNSTRKWLTNKQFSFLLVVTV